MKAKYTVLNQSEMDKDSDVLARLNTVFENGAEMVAYKTQAEWKVLQLQMKLEEMVDSKLVEEFKDAIISWRFDEQKYDE